MTTRLSLATLADLSPAVGRPSYDRSALSPGILHFGVGNFHRSHQAFYLDALFEKGRDHDWAIIGAGVFEGERKGRAVLERQDWLTTVVEQDAGVREARVTGSMIDYVEPADAPAILAAMADPAIRIVSLTITEGGYFIDARTGTFDPAHPAIAADAAAPDAPRTVFGLIVAGLRQRRESGTAPFTVMSCDNIPGNGHVTADAVIGLARLQDEGLADWIGATVAFPNGMVDCITPATSDRERQALREHFGVEDGWPVFCEPFRQWVVEDHFPAGRPAFEAVGVQFVEDVAPFELMKIRILNGGHAAIAYPAALMDIHFVHEAMEHPSIASYLAKLEREEIVPCVPPVPGVVIEDYVQLIERRFSNPTIGDTIRRLCLDGSNRQPKFVLPSTADNLAAGRSISGLALVSALWCRYCQGTTDSGAAIEPNDPNWDRIQAAARAAASDPGAFLAMRDIFGAVGEDERFRAAFAERLARVTRDGAQATIEAYVAGTL